MDRMTLRQEWEANNHRPVWVREQRDAIHEHTDTGEDVPNKGPAAVRAWLDRYKSVVTKQLNAAETEADSE